jgi:hypothetical protein
MGTSGGAVRVHKETNFQEAASIGEDPIVHRGRKEPRHFVDGLYPAVPIFGLSLSAFTA